MLILTAIRNDLMLACDHCGVLSYRYTKNNPPAYGSAVLSTDFQPMWPDTRPPQWGTAISCPHCHEPGLDARGCLTQAEYKLIVLP